MEELDWQSIWPMLVFATVLLGMFWFVVIRPMRIQRRQHQELIAAVEEGDRIVTAGGVYGQIVRVGDNEIDIEVADNCVITFDRRAVRKIVDNAQSD